MRKKYKKHHFFIVFYALVLFQESNWSYGKPSKVEQLTPSQIFGDQKSIKKKTETILSQLTLEQKVGQLFIFGFSGKSVKSQLDKTLKRLTPGAIIAFQKNIKSPWQIAELNNHAQKISFNNSGLPLLIMLDQEGGVVSRIKTQPHSPSALAIGSTENPSLAREAGIATGRVLSLLGFNMNLAPVVDISDPFQINFIGNRSFGNDPHQVKIMGQKFADGLEDAGVLPTLKHFPGHGGSIKDSHFDFPQKLNSLDELLKHDLVPFAHFAEGLLHGAIMVAHIAFPNIDDTNLPATFSYKLVTQILRERLNYKGLVITDDIEMHGASAIPSVGERAVRAFEAGNDMIMVAWTQKNQKQAYDALLRAIKEKRISEERLHASLRRIIISKLTHKNNEVFKKQPQLFMSQLKINLNRLKEISNRVVESNIEKFFFLNHQKMPLINKNQKIVVYSGDGKFFNQFRRNITNPVYFYPLSPSSRNPVSFSMQKHKDGIGLFYITGNGTAKILNQLSAELKKRIIVVNSTNPGRVEQRHLFLGVIDINSRNSNAGSWLANKLANPTKSRMPAKRDSLINTPKRKVGQS